MPTWRQVARSRALFEAGGVEWLRAAVEREFCRRFRDEGGVEDLDAEIPRFADTGDVIAGAIEDIDLVKHWLAGLHQRDPGFARRIKRVDFRMALMHARGWHEMLERQSERVLDRRIPDDTDGAPTVMIFEDGRRWVWLRTDTARDAEGRVQGNRERSV